MSEEIEQITNEEFQNLSDKEKWNFIQTIKKIIKDLEIKANKNCIECEKTTLSTHDVNIDLFFEDWRVCSDHCEECSNEDQRNMCEIQFQLFNHIAQTLLELQRRHNILTKMVLKKDQSGSELLKAFKKEYERKKKSNKLAANLYQ